MLRGPAGCGRRRRARARPSRCRGRSSSARCRRRSRRRRSGRLQPGERGGRLGALRRGARRGSPPRGRAARERRRRAPADLEPLPVAGERAHERGAEREAEQRRCRRRARGRTAATSRSRRRAWRGCGRRSRSPTGCRFITAPKNAPASPQATASGRRPRSRPATLARTAPPTPIAPQAHICHGVHGPWPKNTFDGERRDRADREPGRAAERRSRQISTMSVVGLTFGSGANAIRPSAASAASVATSASTRAVGMRPLVPREAGGQRDAEDEQRGGDPAHRATTCDSRASRLREQRRAFLGEQRAAAEDAGGLRREVPAAAEHLGGRRVGDRARRRRAARCGRPTAAANSASWVATSTAIPAAASSRRCAASASLWPRSMPRVGSSRQTTAGGSPCRTMLEREPLALAAGQVARVAVGERGEAGGLERFGGQLVADALGEQVVAGVLQQQRDAAAALDPAARRLRQPGGEPQQRRLAGAVAAHQRDRSPGASARSTPRSTAGPSRDLEPDAVERERRGGLRPATQASATTRRVGRNGACAVPPSPRARSARARVLHGDRRRSGTPASANRRAPGVCSAGGACSRKPRGSASNARSRRPPARSRGRRRPGSARAGARRARTAVPHSSLTRRSTPSSSSPATGSSWEVGSSSSSSRGRPASAAPSATRCSSPPDSSCVERSSRPRDAERERGLLHPARDRRRAPAAVLERERELGAHGAHHDLRLRVLEQRPGDGGQLGRAVLARVEPARHQPPGELAAVEVRDEPGRRAQQRRLARAGAAREHARTRPARRAGRRRRSAGRSAPGYE